MIMEIPQPICCGISMKSEILRDHDPPRAGAPRASVRKALTIPTHH
jgi:hypothetical protein